MSSMVDWFDTPKACPYIQAISAVRPYLNLLEQVHLLIGSVHVEMLAHNALDNLRVAVVQAPVELVVIEHGVAVHLDFGIEAVDGLLIGVDARRGVLLEKQKIEDGPHEKDCPYGEITAAPGEN